MAKIYFEAQTCSLCGVHAVNALLQAPCFAATDLAEIARSLDDAERLLHGGGGGGGGGAESFNVSDGGDFSVDVLREALRARGVELSGDKAAIEAALASPETESEGFMLNMAEHWLSVRRISGSWWDLNSIHERPEPISPFYLSTFLAQMRADGYTLLIAKKLPDPNSLALSSSLPTGRFFGAAELLANGGARSKAAAAARKTAADRARTEAASDPAYEAALRASLGGGAGGGGDDPMRGGGGGGDDDIARAIAASLADHPGRGGGGGGSRHPLALSSAPPAVSTFPSGPGRTLGGPPLAPPPSDMIDLSGEGGEDAELQAALRLSMGEAAATGAAANGAAAAGAPLTLDSWRRRLSLLLEALPAEPPASSTQPSARLSVRLPPAAPPALARLLPQGALAPAASLRPQRRFDPATPLGVVLDWAEAAWLGTWLGSPPAATTAGAGVVGAGAAPMPAALAFSLSLLLPRREFTRASATEGVTLTSSGLMPSAALELRVAA